MEAAFFDLDKTVIARSSTLALGRPLMREGMITRAQVIKGLYAQLVYHLLGADEAKMDKMRDGLLALTKGWEKAKLEQLIRDTVTGVIEPVIYDEALALVAAHRAAGRRVYIVSSSGEEIVRPLAERLGVPHFIATRAAVDDDGLFTGELAFYCYGENKAVAMREHAERYGIDLGASYAYSDSATDLPMLEAVGYPHAVNPDRELAAAAVEREWPILRFSHPVSLRSRLVAATPKPSPGAALAVGALVLGAFAWAAYRDRARRG
ncbi:MAG TPA: HAD-IB family hydrolase [Actinomycetota bacterium]